MPNLKSMDLSWEVDMIETGGVLIYVREEIPAKQQKRYKTQADVESCFLELNLYRKNGYYREFIDPLSKILNILLMKWKRALTTTVVITRTF